MWGATIGIDDEVTIFLSCQISLLENLFKPPTLLCRQFYCCSDVGSLKRFYCNVFVYYRLWSEDAEWLRNVDKCRFILVYHHFGTQAFLQINSKLFSLFYLPSSGTPLFFSPLFFWLLLFAATPSCWVEVSSIAVPILVGIGTTDAMTKACLDLEKKIYII